MTDRLHSPAMTGQLQQHRKTDSYNLKRCVSMTENVLIRNIPILTAPETYGHKIQARR